MKGNDVKGREWPWRWVWAVIAILAPAAGAAPDEIHLITGDRLTGEVIERTDRFIVLQHAILGRLEIPLDQIAAPEAAASPPPAPAPDVARGAPAQAPPSPAPPIPPEPKRWKSKFELGASGQFGVSDTQTLTAGLTSERSSDTDATHFEARYYYDAADGDRQSNEFRATVVEDWRVPQRPWSFFASGQYEFDEFQSWEHRLSGHGGFGYRLLDGKDLTLKLRAGLGTVREFDSPNEDVRPEGVGGFELTWAITDRQDLIAGSQIFPDFGDVPEFRTRSYVQWSVLVDETSHLSFNVRLDHEYESTTDTGVEHNDLKLSATLGLEF